MRLDLVAAAAAVFVLDDVPGGGQVGDDAVGGAPGDAQGASDVPQSRARLAGDAQQDPGRGWSGSSSCPFLGSYHSFLEIHC